MTMSGKTKKEALKADLGKNAKGLNRNIKKIEKRSRLISLRLSPGTFNFLVVLLFVIFGIWSNGDYGIRSKIKYLQEIDEGKSRLEKLKKEMAIDSITVRQLKTNDHYLEEYVRQHLNMINKNEEAFIVRQ